MSDEEDKLVNDFEIIKSDLLKWGESVDTTIRALLEGLAKDNKVKIGPSCRLKGTKSFLSKALYRAKNYQKPVLDIEDKIGTRVVLLKSSDVYDAAQLITKYSGWNAKTTKDLKQLIEEHPREFDYQSVHLVVWPNQQEPYSSDTKLLTCEIQIRTLLQHAFAEISHDSTYKGPYKNDQEIIRNLSKSIALMEVTDDYFVKIFQLISDGERTFALFYKELIALYKTFKPDYIDARDVELADIVFSLLLKQEVSFASLQEFVIKRRDDILAAIQKPNSYLFEEPVILLISYYLYNHKNFLTDNWPLSDVSLKTVFNGFNFSYS